MTQLVPVPHNLLEELIGFTQKAADSLKRRPGAKAARESIQRTADEARGLLDDYAPLS